MAVEARRDIRPDRVCPGCQNNKKGVGKRDLWAKIYDTLFGTEISTRLPGVCMDCLNEIPDGCLAEWFRMRLIRIIAHDNTENEGCNSFWKIQKGYEEFLAENGFELISAEARERAKQLLVCEEILVLRVGDIPKGVGWAETNNRL